MKFSPDATIRSCVSVSPTQPLLLEKKYDGFRLTYEGLSNSDSGTFFTKKAEQTKFFPHVTATLLNKYLRDKGIDDIVLDGEGFLSECFTNSHTRVPIIGTQQKAIRGEHPNLIKNCKFTFQVFDIIRYKKKIVTDMPLKDRKKLLKMIFPAPVEGSATKHGITPRFEKNITIVPVQGKVMTQIEDIVDEYCQVVADGHEGIMLKDLHSRYEWENLDREDRSGWWKVKEERDVDVEVTRACLGNEKYSNTQGNNTFRYKKLDIGICATPDCNTIDPVGRTGAQIKGSSIAGFDEWDSQIHHFVLDLLKKGKATPTKDWRFLDDVKHRAGISILPEQMFTRLIADTTQEGRIGLPECITLPKHTLIATVFTNEIQLNADKSITLRGPPRIGRLRPDKDRPNDRDYVLSLMGTK